MLKDPWKTFETFSENITKNLNFFRNYGKPIKHTFKTMEDAFKFMENG